MKWANFTKPRVDGMECMPGKKQSIFWDGKTPGLGVRVTAAGAKSYIFETKLAGKTARITIGSTDTWTVAAAQAKATSYRKDTDAGIDPRQIRADADASKKMVAAVIAATKVRDTLTVDDAWSVYLSERRSQWGDRHYADHIAKAQPGGKLSARGTRGTGTTIAGPLHSLMAMRLCDLDAATIEAWAAKQAASRPTSARLAWRILKVFLGWCSEQTAYKSYLPATNPAKSTKSRKAFGKTTAKSDVLLREQLSAWFDAVRKISNPVIAAALQVMLLTGARPGEVLAIKWADLNIKWKGLRIRDKVEGTREIPLTPYMWHLIAALPRRSEHVFSGAKEESISSPNHALVRACAVAGIDGLTLHGLRRSFKSLTEWLDIPAGVVAQLMGHKPSATAEKHYAVRPLDLLRLHHEKIERWMLEQAGIDFVPAQEGLRMVNS